MGISAGAALSAKYVGLFGKEGVVKAYASVSNPFNFARVSFHMENLFWGRIVSKFITGGFKKVVSHHFQNPVFQELVRQKNLDGLKEFEQADTCWKLDSVFTYKLGSGLTRLRQPVLVLPLEVLRKQH